MKYNLEYTGQGLVTDTGTWHDFAVYHDGEQVATCCMFIWSLSGIEDEDGSISEAGQPDCQGLHYGDGANRPDDQHSDLDLSELQGDALAALHDIEGNREIA